MGLITAGGGLTKLRLRRATAQMYDVISGKTFYAGDKNLKTGTLEERSSYTDVTDIVSAEQTAYIRIPMGAYRTPTSVGKPEIRVPLDNVKNALPGGNQRSWSATIDPGGVVAIPQGYHDGSGTVRANPASVKVRTATLNASGSYAGEKVFTAAGPVICAGCQDIRDGSYITVSWSGNQITVRETANSGQNRNITIVYAYYI